MADLVTALRRQLAEHERAAAELREIIAEMSSGAGQLNGADVLVAELREECRELGIYIKDDEAGAWVDGRGLAKLVRKSPLTVRNWRGEERIPCRKINGAYHYQLEDIARYRIEYR